MFIAAGLSAFIMPALWVSFLTGNTTYSADLFSMLDWHAFEMYAGFTNALIAGFLLTASVSWSGQTARSGWPLVLLLLCWLSERILVLVPGLHPLVHYAYHFPFSALFLILLYLQLKGNKKNFLIFIPWLIAFTAAKFIFLSGGLYQKPELIKLSKFLHLGLIRVLIVIITGRIVPFFMHTRIHFRPVVPTAIEVASTMTIVLLFLPDLIALPVWLSSLVYIAAFMAHSARFIYWQPWRTIKAPILVILQVGYLWLIAHLAGSALSFTVVKAGNFSLHIFTAGALGTFAIAMMTRVALGHTGRKIKADGWILSMYACVLIGAFLRTLIPLFFPEVYVKSLHYSSGFWTMGFLIYLVRFTPILVRKRADAENQRPSSSTSFPTGTQTTTSEA